jgi:protease-4
MRDFLKFTLASCLGFFIAGALLTLLFIAGISALIATTTGGTPKTVLSSESVLALDFTRPLPEHTNNLTAESFTLQEYDVPGLHDVAALIRHAAEDDKISGILIENGMSFLGSSSSRIILDALAAFKESDKFLVAYGDYYTQNGYYLASIADHITLHPVGTIDFRGYASYVPFFKELLDKLSLDMQVYYAGDFKSATEPFRRTDMSPENKLQTREFLQDIYTMYLEDIADARQLATDSLKQLAWEFKIRNSDDALRYKLVDEIGSKSDAEAWMNEKLGKSHNEKLTYVSIEEYASATPLNTSNYKVKEKIAVVYAEGEILSGHDEYGVIDDGRYVKLLKELRRQEDIKAVVLRINSPGGNILSAENIYRQLTALQSDGKKLVVSMGDLAASGGYYLSAMADSIFAQPNTLTGSIGVFSLIPNPARALDEKLGVQFDTVRTGPYSADFTLMFPWSERENTYLQKRTDAYYELFLEKVAEGRNMTRDEVHAVAQGRIWSGERARELGLVDRIGDLDDAIGSAATLAGLEAYRVKEYPVLQNPLQKLITDIIDPKNAGISAVFNLEWPQWLNAWDAVQTGAPQARLPFGFKIK